MHCYISCIYVLSALEPLKVIKLLLACADIGVQQHLVDQLARLLQVCMAAVMTYTMC